MVELLDRLRIILKEQVLIRTLKLPLWQTILFHAFKNKRGCNFHSHPDVTFPAVLMSHPPLSGSR